MTDIREDALEPHDTSSMLIKTRVFTLVIACLIAPLPIVVFYYTRFDGFAIGDIGLYGYILSPHVALVAWLLASGDSVGQRILVLCFTCLVSIPGHIAIFREFQRPIGADAQVVLVLVVVPAYQWLAIVCGYTLSTAVLLCLRQLGVNSSETDNMKERDEDD